MWPDPPPCKARDVQRRAAALVLNSKLRDELALFKLGAAGSGLGQSPESNYPGKLHEIIHCIAHFFRIPSGPGLGCPASQHLWPLSETIRASCPGLSVAGNWCDQTREEA